MAGTEPTKKPTKPKTKAVVKAKTTKPRKSTTGGPGKREVDQTNWRKQLLTRRIKFDDKAKGRFLNHFAKTGRVKHSADAAGVTTGTIENHVKNDPDFAEALEEAKGTYRDSIMEQAYKVSVEGVERPIIGGRNKDQVVAKIREYDTKILSMEMRRVNPDYRDHSTVDINQKAGVLVIPGGVSVEDWEAALDEHQLELEKRNEEVIDV